MVNTSKQAESGLRPALTAGEYATGLGHGGLFERGGWVVLPDRKLGQILHRRPLGITAHQWSSASRTQLAFVACDPVSYLPVFAVECHDPAGRGADALRADRMANAVCEAVGLGVFRVESAALRLGSHARRVVEYVIDARTFHDASPGEPGGSLDVAGSAEEPTGYRDIIGRLPDGRSGFVNDLGAVARAAAVDAYVARQLADPIIRSLHACWPGGPAEGWAWLEVRDGGCVFERTRIWQHRFACGVDPGRLAEDLATAAIGERLKTLDTDPPVLRGKQQLARDLDELRARRDEMVDGFAFDHVTFD
jgi:hypothetical protein